MQLIGTIPATSNGKGGCAYQQQDLDNLCGQDDHSCKLYLNYDQVKGIMNVYGVGCDKKKRFCHNKSKGTNANLSLQT